MAVSFDEAGKAVYVGPKARLASCLRFAVWFACARALWVRSRDVSSTLPIGCWPGIDTPWAQLWLGKWTSGPPNSTRRCAQRCCFWFHERLHIDSRRISVVADRYKFFEAADAADLGGHL